VLQVAKDGKQSDIIQDPDAVGLTEGLNPRFVEVLVEGADHIGTPAQSSLDDALIVRIGYHAWSGDRIGHLSHRFELGKSLPNF
jgi:hypothetical protein